MPDVTKYATTPEVRTWLGNACEENAEKISKKYDGVGQMQVGAMILHYDRYKQPKGEASPSEAQKTNGESIFSSAFLEAVSKVPRGKEPARLSMLIPVNHKLDKRKDNLLRRIFGSAHWTGLAIDVTLTAKEVAEFRAFQEREEALSERIKSCKVALQKKESLSQMLGALDEDTLRRVLAKQSAANQSIFQELAKWSKEKARLEKRIEEQWDSPYSRERAVNKEALERVNDYLDRWDKTLTPESLPLIELIETERKISEEALKTEQPIIKAGMERFIDERIKPKCTVKHYDSWGGEARSARYKAQVDGLLEVIGLPPSTSEKVHAQRVTTSTCGEHTAINLARHVGCETIFGQRMSSVDLANNDTNLRRISGEGLQAVQGRAKTGTGTERDRVLSNELDEDKQWNRLPWIERNILGPLKHFFFGIIADSVLASLKSPQSEKMAAVRGGSDGGGIGVSDIKKTVEVKGIAEVKERVEALQVGAQQAPSQPVSPPAYLPSGGPVSEQGQNRQVEVRVEKQSDIDVSPPAQEPSSTAPKARNR